MLCIVGALGMRAQLQEDVTATYLTNADFSSGTPIDNHICTYGKDMATNGTTYYGAQPIEGWTNASVGATDEGYENSKLAGGLFAYGSTPWIGGAGTPAPATDPDGNAGNAAGLCAVWGGSVRYTQDVTLPAGSYTVRFKVYNATTNNGSGKFVTTNLFGFDAGSNTYYSPATTFAIGQWTTVAVTFNLTEETAGKISMGYEGPEGNAAMPHLFVDNVKILKNPYYTDKTSVVGIVQASWIGSSEMPGGFTATTDDGRSSNMCALYGSTAVNDNLIYQDISGLDPGTYEVQVYAQAQNEWNNNGATLQNDKGDAVYVFGKGVTIEKTFINARRGPGMMKNGGPKVYSISGVTTTDGSLRIGLGIAVEGQTEWNMIQIKSLVRVSGLDLSNYVTAYENALAAAKDFDQDQTMSATTKIALNGAISTYAEGKVDKTSQEALETAANALKAALAAADKSVASYAVIAAGSIPDNSLDGWVCENTNTFHINTWSGEGNNDGSNMKTPFIENWVAKGSFLGAGKVYYKLEGLEPGEVYYAQALVRSYNEASSEAPNGPDFFINDAETSLSEVGTTFQYNNMSGIYATLGGVATVGSDGTLTLGVKIASDRNYNWVAFKNVSIQSMDKAFDAAVAKVTALENKIPTAAYQTATAVVDQYSGANYPTTAAGFETAIAAIEAAATSASALVDPYAKAKAALTEGATMATNYPNLTTPIANATAALEGITTVGEINTFNTNVTTAINTFDAWLKIKAYGDALVAVDNDNSEANTTLNNVITEQEAKVQAVNEIGAEGLDIVTTATSTLKTAMTTYVGVANPVGDGAKFDCTFMLTNPNLEGLPTWTGATGWLTEQDGGNSQVMVNPNATSTDGTKTAFYEYWKNPPTEVNKFALYQKVTLPVGTYNMSCYAFAQYEQEGKHDNIPNGVYFYANDVQGSAVNNARLSLQSIEFVNNTENQEVKIGLKPVTGNGNTWMGIGYVELYKVPAQSYEISETAAYDNTQSGAGNVTLTRTIKEGYNTLVLPFSMTQTEVETNFGEGAIVYEVKEYNQTTENLTFNVREGISANEPVVLKATVAGSSYELADRTIVAGEPVKAGINVQMVGSYAATYEIAKDANNFIISDGQLWEVASDEVTIKNTRAYINITTSGAAKVREMIFEGESGESTGISEIAGESNAVNGKIYDLSGREVKNPAKGIYIKNGKKVLVK